MALYIIANPAGFAAAQRLATDDTPWDVAHTALGIAAHAGGATMFENHTPSVTRLSKQPTIFKGFKPRPVPPARTSLPTRAQKRWIVPTTHALAFSPRGARWFTDGSVKDGTAGAGIWAAHLEEGESFHFPEGPQDIGRAELIALREAVRKACAAAPETPTADFFLDSAAILFGLRKFVRTPLRTVNNPYHETFTQIVTDIQRAGLKTAFWKVRSHTEVAGNDMADEAANQGRKNKHFTEPNEPATLTPNVTDWPDGVAVWGVGTKQVKTTDDQTGVVTEETVPTRTDLYQIKSINKWIKQQQWFIGGKASEWRELLGLTGGDTKVAPIPKGVVHPDKYWWATWLKLMHKEIFTQTRAQQYLKGVVKQIHALQETGRAPKNLGKFTYFSPPPLSAMCPLCNAELDTWAHPILRCRHKMLSDMNFNTHQELFEIIFHTIIQTTDLGQWFATADLPGHRWYDNIPTREATYEGTHALRAGHVGETDSDESDDEARNPQRKRNPQNPQLPLDRADSHWDVWAAGHAEPEPDRAARTSPNADTGAEEKETAEAGPTWADIQGAAGLPDYSSGEESDPAYEPSESDQSDSGSLSGGPTHPIASPGAAAAGRGAAPPEQGPKISAQTLIDDWIIKNDAPSSDDEQPPPPQHAQSRPNEDAATKDNPDPATEDGAPCPPDPPGKAALRRRRRRQRLFDTTGTLKFAAAEIPDPEPESPEIDESQRKIREKLSRSGCSPSGLPAWFGVFTTSRPDAIIIEGLKFANRRKAPTKTQKLNVIVHLFEFTRTSEAYFAQSYAKKKEQHALLCQALTARGWKWKLHILQMGCRGHMPVDTMRTLKNLGNDTTKQIRGTKFTHLYKKLSLHAIKKAYSMIRVRRALESDPSWRPYNVRRTEKHGWEQTKLFGTSGMAAMRDAKKKRKLMQMEQNKSHRPA